MTVARRIVAAIDRQGLSPGDRLPAEKQMIDEYQVGRGTLREALRYLELSGVISLKPGPGGGPTVEKPDASNLMNSLALVLQFEGAPFATIVEARVGLEPLMARLAAERITDEQRYALTESVSKMGENIRDLGVFLETNQAFHDIVAWASGNALLACLIDAVDGSFARVARGLEYPGHRRTAVYTAHRDIHHAIVAGNADAAEAAMRAHVLDLVEYLRKRFPAALAKPITWDSML